MRFSRPTYWADHNARFAQAPASADDFHVARPRGLRLDPVFRLEETRTVSNDWVVRYDNRAACNWRGRAVRRRRAARCWSAKTRRARSRFAIAAARMRWTEIVRRRGGGRAARRTAPPARTVARRGAAPRPIIRGASASKAVGATSRLAARRSPTSSPWKPPQPWTRPNAPPLLRGDISIELTQGTFLTSFDINCG